MGQLILQPQGSTTVQLKHTFWTSVRYPHSLGWSNAEAIALNEGTSITNEVELDLLSFVP